MQYVTVAFHNGNIVHFTAQEFDVNISQHGIGHVHKYSYKDAQGGDSFIHLKPSEVAGIFITQPAERGDPPIVYKVAGGAS